MLECEELIQQQINKDGSLATGESLLQFDTDGKPIIVGGKKLTSKGRINKTCQTPYGEVEIKRHFYQGTMGGRGYCPLEGCSLGRLRTVTRNGVLSEAYQYNTNGARIYEMNARRNISGRDLTYSQEDHLLTAGNVAYQYNADGFLTQKTEGAEVTTYNYSSRGELPNVTLPTAGRSATFTIPSAAGLPERSMARLPKNTSGWG